MSPSDVPRAIGRLIVPVVVLLSVVDGRCRGGDGLPLYVRFKAAVARYQHLSPETLAGIESEAADRISKACTKSKYESALPWRFLPLKSGADKTPRLDVKLLELESGDWALDIEVYGPDGKTAVEYLGDLDRKDSELIDLHAVVRTRQSLVDYGPTEFSDLPQKAAEWFEKRFLSYADDHQNRDGRRLQEQIGQAIPVAYGLVLLKRAAPKVKDDLQGELFLKSQKHEDLAESIVWMICPTRGRGAGRVRLTCEVEHPAFLQRRWLLVRHTRWNGNEINVGKHGKLFMSQIDPSAFKQAPSYLVKYFPKP
jgi:hypothetical protein